ncbi:MAG: hypothetical protein ABII21_02235 [bacterium]
MKNWNTNTTKFKSKLDKTIWEISQIINFGFDGTKLSKQTLTKHWTALLPHLSPDRARMIEWVTWGKQSLRSSKNKSWNKSNLIPA